MRRSVARSFSSAIHVLRLSDLRSIPSCVRSLRPSSIIESSVVGLQAHSDTGGAGLAGVATWDGEPRRAARITRSCCERCFAASRVASMGLSQKSEGRASGCGLTLFVALAIFLSHSVGSVCAFGAEAEEKGLRMRPNMDGPSEGGVSKLVGSAHAFSPTDSARDGGARRRPRLTRAPRVVSWRRDARSDRVMLGGTCAGSFHGATKALARAAGMAKLCARIDHRDASSGNIGRFSF